jgi:hypothetical protein
MSIIKVKKKIPRLAWLIPAIIAAAVVVVTISVLIYFRVMADISRNQMNISDDKSIAHALKYSSKDSEFLLELANELAEADDTVRSSAVILYMIQNVEADNEQAYLLLAENYKNSNAERVMINQIYDWAAENIQSDTVLAAKSEFIESDYTGSQLEDNFNPVNNQTFTVSDNNRINKNGKNITEINAYMVSGDEKILVAAGTNKNPGLYVICFDGYIYARISNIEALEMAACSTGVYAIDAKDNRLKLIRYDAGGIKVLGYEQMTEFVLTGEGVCYIDTNGALVLDNGTDADLGDGNTALNLELENGRPVFTVCDLQLNSLGRFSANSDGKIISEPLEADE